MSILAKIPKHCSGTIRNFLKGGDYIKRNISNIKEYDIIWEKPKKLPFYHPENTGDLGLQLDVKQTEIALHYNKSKELEDASETVKKLFSLEYMPMKETRNLKREKVLSLVKRHDLDRGSIETQIAAMTTEIQYLQEYVKTHKKNGRTNKFLKELIDKRNMFLKRLRTLDYRRYEWVLEKLNLIFKSGITDPKNPALRSTRKNALRELTKQYCDKIKQEKIDKYKARLQNRQETFFMEKVEKLIFIRNEEIACGVEPTVTEEDIEAARKKAEEVS